MNHKLKYFLYWLDPRAFLLGMLIALLLVLLTFSVIPVDAAKYDSTTTAIGDVIISHATLEYMYSNKPLDGLPLDKGQMVKNGQMGSQFVMGTGSSGLSRDITVDSTNMQTIRQNTLAQATNGGVGWESNVMETDRNAMPDVICDSAGNIAETLNTTGNTPLKDSAEYYAYADGQAFTYTNERSIDQQAPDARVGASPDVLQNNLSVQGVEGYYATGGYYFTASTIEGSNKSANEINAEMFVREHEVATGKDTALDFSNSKSWQLFGDAFGFDSPSNLSANETNESVVSNITNSSPIGE